MALADALVLVEDEARSIPGVVSRAPAVEVGGVGGVQLQRRGGIPAEVIGGSVETLPGKRPDRPRLGSHDLPPRRRQGELRELPGADFCQPAAGLRQLEQGLQAGNSPDAGQLSAHRQQLIERRPPGHHRRARGHRQQACRDRRAPSWPCCGRERQRPCGEEEPEQLYLMPVLADVAEPELQQHQRGEQQRPAPHAAAIPGRQPGDGPRAHRDQAEGDVASASDDAEGRAVS